jgi:hypothetical protein
MAAREITLGRTERALWTGAPKQGLILRSSDVFVIPFSVVWAGGVLTIFTSAHWRSARGAFVLMPALFLAMGLYITVGRFVVDMVARARTTYALTTERVIIQSGVFTPTVKSLNLRTLSDVTLSERGNGDGTITFGPGNPWGAWGNGMRWPGMPPQPVFEGIPNARTVYGMIREAQRTAGMPA